MDTIQALDVPSESEDSCEFEESDLIVTHVMPEVVPTNSIEISPETVFNFSETKTPTSKVQWRKLDLALTNPKQRANISKQVNNVHKNSNSNLSPEDHDED